VCDFLDGDMCFGDSVENHQRKAVHGAFMHLFLATFAVKHRPFGYFFCLVVNSVNGFVSKSLAGLVDIIFLDLKDSASKT
jgi:hypothetical protein